MAKQLNINLQFTADIAKAKDRIKELTESLDKINEQFVLDIDSSKMTKEIFEAQGAAISLKNALQSAVNVKTGSIDLLKFNQSLKKAGIELSDLQKNLKNLGPEGQRAFTQLAGTIIQAETPIKRANGLLNEMWTTLRNSIRWQISSSAIHGFMSTISGAYNYAKDLNTSLNNIRIVSGESAENMATFAVEANKAAKALDATTVAYTDAALIYFQQGWLKMLHLRYQK